MSAARDVLRERLGLAALAELRPGQFVAEVERAQLPAIAAGYHDNGSGGCVLDQQCPPNTCSSHGQCGARGGVVACVCSEEYTGTWLRAMRHRLPP